MKYEAAIEIMGIRRSKTFELPDLPKGEMDALIAYINLEIERRLTELVKNSGDEMFQEELEGEPCPSGKEPRGIVGWKSE